MKKVFRFSKFLTTIKKKDVSAIFHRLHPLPVLFLKTAIWRTFLKNIGERKYKRLVAKLKKYQLIVYSNKDEERELRHIKNNLKKRTKRVFALFLVLTYNCNLRCKYCFIPQLSREGKNIIMTPGIAKRGIDLWIKHIKEDYNKNNDYSIIFYGGEPLFNFRTLKESLKYIKKIQQKKRLLLNNLQILLDTNGTLIDQKVIRILKRYHVKVNLSLDGPQEIHDYYRKDKEGRNTFKRVLKALRLLRGEEIDNCISITVTPHNIKRIKDFSKFLSKQEIKEFSFIPLTDQAILSLNSKINLEKYHKKIATEIINSFEKIRKRGIYEYRIEEKTKAFLRKNFFIMDCGGYGNQIVIQPDGMVSNCPTSTKYNIKHVNNWGKGFKIWNSYSVKNWRKRLPLYTPKCLKCEAISICGGGCPWAVDMIKRNIFHRDESACIFSKKFLEFFIFELINKNQKFI